MFVSKKLSCILAAMCALVLSVGSAWAQNITVTGKVVDKSNEPIVGAYVVIEGTTTGTSTDLDGAFSLSVPAKGTLKFTCMGYKDVTVAVNGQANVNVTMEDDTMMLEETVVTALGIKKEKKSLGYAVQDLGSGELMKNKSANAITSLSGKIAGVNITQASGAAGSGAQIILRGGTSASENKDNQPLFVVDGIIYDNSSTVVGNSAFDGTFRQNTTTTNRVMDVNPDDIENMSILKGPAASALYGSRAANGVVIITTKKGKEGAVKVNFNSKFSTNWVSSLPEVQTTYGRGYLEQTNDPKTGALISTAYNDFSYDSWGDKKTGKIYDNLGNFYQPGITVDETLSVAGGTKTNNFYLSGSYYNQKGVVPTTGYKKYTFRFNGEQKIGKIFTVGANAAYSKDFTTKTLTGKSFFSQKAMGALYATYVWSPFDDMTHYLNEDGTRYRMFGDRLDPWDERTNPYWVINKDKMTDETSRFTGSISVKADIFDWWNVSYKLGFDTYTQKAASRVAPGGVLSLDWQNGMISDNEMNFNYLTHNVLSNMNWKIKDFDLGLVLGGQWDETTTHRIYSMGLNLQVPEFYSYDNIPDANKRFSRGNSMKRIMGVFGEFRASWKNMIYLTVTGRNDWTSTLPAESRSYFYPSVSGSFVFTELLPKNDVLDFGKVRVSWAQVGKDTGVYETTTSLWPVGTYLLGKVGLGNSWTRGNPYLKPEITRSFEAGLEMHFFKNRLGFDFAYYTNNSFNQILSPRGPQSTGYIFCSINAANVYNKGMELAINATPIEKKNFKWDIGFNIAGNRGTLDGLPDGTNVMYVTDVQYATAQAASFNKGKFMGIAGTKWNYTKDGKLILDNNGIPTWSNDLVEVGNRECTVAGGLNNTFDFYGVSVNMMWEFRLGGDVVNGTQYAMDNAGTSKFSGDIRQQTLHIEGVRQVGKDDEGNPIYGQVESFDFAPDGVYNISGTMTPGLNVIKNYYTQSYMKHTANYITKVNSLRMRTISVSYSLPQSVLRKQNVLSGVTFSISGNNLLLFSNYNGDPEVAASGSGVGGSSSVGFDYCGVPATAGATFGINLAF
ncbi:MAG: SusC/RagA family TonB-linked outer membrane protein [Bacteroidales bacterium]|nr:SusC/RagA family TonB-linked outer membrane protein [Candidatus Cacconaster equi]